MSISRGASRLYGAIKFAITWPTYVKVEPFSTLDMERILALPQPDHTTSISSFNDSDVEVLSSRWKVHSVRPFDNSRSQSSRDQARSTESAEGPTSDTEEVQTVSLATHKKTLADKDAVEAAIRHEADPNGIYSRDTIDTAGLVRSIRKRHRDALEEHRRDKNAMRIEKETLQQRFEDEKGRLENIIRSRSEQDQSNRDELHEVESKYRSLHADNEAKDSRITELEEETKTMKQTCKTVTEGSVETLKRADRSMKYQITCIERKHQQDLAELRGWNNILQDRLNIARRLQPSIIIHKAQVGTVCEMREKLVQFKKAKKEEMAVKEEEIKNLRSSNDYRQRWILDLQSAATEDGKILKDTNKYLSDTRKALREAESKMASHEREVNRLNKWGKEWENGCKSKSQMISKQQSEMSTLRATHRTELVEARAKNEGLESTIKWLREARDKMDEELESWENGQGGRTKVSTPNTNNTRPGTDVKSLVQALKASNTRANTLQISVNALQAENAVFQKQLGEAANAPSPQVQEHVERLMSENQRLTKAAEHAENLKTQVISQATARAQEVEQLLADRTRELELGFNQSFESLRELRDQWFLQKRGLEKEVYREMVAASTRHNIELQGREDRFSLIWKDKETELRRREVNLQSREAELLSQASSLPSAGQNIVNTETPAESVEGEVHRVQVNSLPSTGQKIVNTEIPAEKVEGEVHQTPVVEPDTRTHQDSIEEHLSKENVSLRRDGQRHLDLLNEELSKLTEDYRLLELHNELQTANCSINYFEYELMNVETKSEALSQTLYGADVSESDAHLLQTSGRPILLAQLQAAKCTLGRLRSLLAKSPNVEKDKAISILREPRGDEDAAQPIDDIFGQWEDSQQTPHPSSTSRKRSGPPHPSISRKRSGPPLGAPTYGEHEDNAANDDWGDQEAADAGRVSTPQEILNRQKFRLKSRRNVGPGKAVQQRTDPAIRDQ